MTALKMISGCAAVLCALSFQPAAAQRQEWPVEEVARRADSNPAAFGPLTLGMAESEVQAKLGLPASASRRAAMMMSDEVTYTWEYPDLGVTLYMSAFDESSPGSVLAIKVGPPCEWAALGGLKVGLNIDQAEKILKKQRGGGVSPLGSVGTDTAGLYFEFSETALVARLAGGMVSGLYLGPNLP